MNPATTRDADARVTELLDAYLAAAREGRPPDRDAFLAQHKDLADALRVALVGFDFVQRAGERLSSPDAAPDGPLPPGTLGDFRIVTEVGRGGMGVVYEAEQISLRRRVALKVLPFAGVLDQKQLQRFRNEAQAAAHLHHTNIVPVYSVGSERGVHYYAMQFIEGESLARAIGEMKGGGTGEGSPRSPISSHGSNRTSAYLRMAARIGMQAAEALDHAHQLGIVHRDVKPGNLLVDGAGNLWITDFGLARFSSEPGLTVTGDLVGTFRYMSPEQALAKRVPIDHRTDVYSLGATLYELITLEPAVKGDDPQAVLQEIAFKDPMLPRRINPAIPADIETILLKAMWKDPAGRYATAQEMADDLRRFLENKSVLARRPTVATRVAKWSRRHRGLVAASLAVLLVGFAALAVGSSREARNTRREAQNARAALARANATLRFAREAVDTSLTELGVHGLEGEVLPTPARKALLEKALLFYDTFLAEQGDPGALVQRGYILHGLQRYDESLAAFERFLAVRPGDVECLEQRGHMLWHLRRHDEALAALDEAARVDPARAVALVYRGNVLRALKRGDEALDAFDRAIEIDPNYAMAHNNRGNALNSLGRFDDALEACDRAIEIDPNLALAHSGRGSALGSLGRFDDALVACDRAIAIDPADAAGHDNRGNALRSLGRLDDALEAHDRAIAIEPNRAGAHTNRGNALHSLRRFHEALEAYDRAIAIDPNLAVIHSNRGGTLGRLGRFDDALAAHDRAIEIDPNAAGAHSNRGNALWSLGRFDEALAAHDRAIAIDPNLAAAHTNRGGALWSLGRFDEALEAHDRAIAINPNYAELLANARGAAAAAGSAELNPESADSQYEAGVGLVACAEMAARDTNLGAAERARVARAYAEQAKAVLVRASQLAPDGPSYRIALGRACVRAEDWKGAVEALDNEPEGYGAFEQFLLATALARLRHADQARRCYEQGVARMDASRADADSRIQVSSDGEPAGKRSGEDAAAAERVDDETLRAPRLVVERLLGLLDR
jgi:tetratricopeptide (TPR) repeat protein